MSSPPHNRASAFVINGVAFGICVGLLAYAYYLQYFEQLDPCPLCILQRLAVAALGVIFFLAMAHRAGPTGRRVYAFLIAVISVAGSGIAARHVWLQHLPADQVPECGPSLDYMLEVLPLSETLTRIFTASGQCAEISWMFLGLSLPAWTLAWFTMLGVMGFTANWWSRGA